MKRMQGFPHTPTKKLLFPRMSMEVWNLLPACLPIFNSPPRCNLQVTLLQSGQRVILG
uniref:Uncharacterized protein n=1 Tax=Arundo donax TaxID=35708 RepID=A0A0A9I259_ARUDO